MTVASLESAIRAINAGGTVAVLIVAIYLGLRGEVVTGAELRDCRMARDAYLAGWLRAITDSDLTKPQPAPRP